MLNFMPIVYYLLLIIGDSSSDFLFSVKATTVNRLNYNRRKLRVMYKTDKPSNQIWHMDNPSCAEKTDKRSFLFGNHNY